jgi:hypothetical protein
MSSQQIFNCRPQCPKYGTEMTKAKRYDGAYATEWAQVTVSSSLAASANLYQEKSVYKCPSCGKMLLT